MNLVVKVTAMKMMTVMMMMMMVMMMMRYYPCMVHSCLTLIKVKIVHYFILKSLFQMLPIEKKSKKLDKKKARDKLVLFR